MDKSINKIRKLLGSDYHLSVKLVPNEIEWVLYRNYLDTQVYFSKDNEAIMSSKTNTLDDLYKFAKEHRKIDGLLVETVILEILALVLLMLQVINFMTLKNNNIRSFIFGADWIIIVSCLIKLIIFDINDKKKQKEIREEFKRSMERFKK